MKNRIKKTKLPLTDILGECGLFSQLPFDTIKQISGYATLRRFSDKQIILHCGQKACGFYIVSSGSVEVFRISETGRRQVLHLIEEGQTLGEVPMFQGGCYPASAVACGDTEAVYIDGEKFLDDAFEHPQILLEMLAVLSMRLRKFVNLIDDLSLKDVSQRLLQYITSRADKDGVFAFDCSKAELAERLGTIPETISRALNRLKTEQKISTQNAKIILNKTKKQPSL